MAVISLVASIAALFLEHDQPTLAVLEHGKPWGFDTEGEAGGEDWSAGDCGFLGPGGPGDWLPVPELLLSLLLCDHRFHYSTYTLHKNVLGSREHTF